MFLENIEHYEASASINLQTPKLGANLYLTC